MKTGIKNKYLHKADTISTDIVCRSDDFGMRMILNIKILTGLNPLKLA